MIDSFFTQRLPQFIHLVEQFPIRFITGQCGCQIAYRHIIHQQSTDKLVILVNGRGENIYKWSEVAYDFYLQNYDVLLLDHRGQGFSQRLLPDLEKGYIDNFSFYAKDLDVLIKFVCQSKSYQWQYLLAHSLGALIASDYLANYDHFIRKAVFSAPFFGIPYPKPWRDQLLISVMMLCGKGKDYIFGKGVYKPVEPQNNLLSSSVERMTWMNQIIQQNNELRTGGPTFRWLHLATNAIARLPKLVPKIEIPILILQAEQELIVNNQSLNRISSYFPQRTLSVVKKAKHEILFEQDKIRDHALSVVFDFLAS